MAQGPIEDDDGVGAAIVQAAEDAKAYALAQIELYKAIARARVRAARTMFVLGTAAAVLAGGALSALLIGLIMTLAPRYGPLSATGIVVGATLVVAGILGFFAMKRFEDIMADIE